MRSRPPDALGEPPHLELSIDPVEPQDAATKRYIDDLVGTAEFVQRGGDTMTGSLSITGNSRLLIQSLLAPGLGTGTIRLEGGQGNTIQFANAGGMRWQFIEEHYVSGSGPLDDFVLIRGAAPGTISLIASWADGHIALRQPSTMTGDPVGDDDLARKVYVDNLFAQGPDLPTLDLRYLRLIGGALTGPLVLAADPANDPEAATKRYVDQTATDAGLIYVHKGGDTMTGLLTLSADPTAPLHAVTRQYVDRIATGTTLVIGVFEAPTDTCHYIPASGLPSGPLVPAADAGEGRYLVCDEAGIMPPTSEAAGLDFNVGDWVLSDGAAWIRVRVGAAGSTARGVSLIPPIFGVNNVQDGLQAAETALGDYLPLAGGTMTGQLALAGDPLTALDAVPRRYLDARGLFPWTTTANYVVNQAVLYDNRGFLVRVPIDNAPATPDFATIVPLGYGQSDYWHGDRPAADANWVVGNWVHICNLPAYGTYNVQISDLHTQQDTSLSIAVVTSFNRASATLTKAHQGTGSWSELRLSQTGTAQPCRLELRIASRGGSQNFKITIGGETRGLTANQVVIMKPPVAIAGGATLGGTQLAIIRDLQEAGFAVSNQMIVSNGNFLKFYHTQPTDANDGRIGARLFGRGLNIVGIATEPAPDNFRVIRCYGQVEMAQANSFVTDFDGQGLVTFAGGRFYKASGTGVVIRQPTGNQQPQIENNDGTNRRFILDTINGVKTTGQSSIQHNGGNPLVIRNVNPSNVWNQKQLCVAHDDASGGATNTQGEAGVAFYNYNNATNGGLRKASIILQRTAGASTRNVLRCIDGDSNQLCDMAAAAYVSTFARGSPLAQFAESDDQTEIDLVAVIEALVARVQQLEARLA
jgi:hypothetical protein